MHSGLYMCEDRKLEAMIELIDEPFDFGEGIITPLDNREYATFLFCYKTRRNLKLDYIEILELLEEVPEPELLKTNGRNRAERRKNNHRHINKRIRQSKNVMCDFDNVPQQKNKYNKNNPDTAEYIYSHKQWRDWWHFYKGIHAKVYRKIESCNDQIEKYHDDCQSEEVNLFDLSEYKPSVGWYEEYYHELRLCGELEED